MISHILKGGGKMKNLITENSSQMKEVTFRNLSKTEQLRWINQRLQDTGSKVEELAKEIGISSSSLSFLMKESGCRYSRAKKQYLPIIETNNPAKTEQQEFTEYLLTNAEVIRKIIDESSSKRLIFDSSIYQTNNPFTSKTVKIKKDTLDEFQRLLKEQFPQFRTQDVLTQAIIDFINKYK